MPSSFSAYCRIYSVDPYNSGQKSLLSWFLWHWPLFWFWPVVWFWILLWSIKNAMRKKNHFWDSYEIHINSQRAATPAFGRCVFDSFFRPLPAIQNFWAKKVYYLQIKGFRISRLISGVTNRNLRYLRIAYLS